MPCPYNIQDDLASIKHLTDELISAVQAGNRKQARQLALSRDLICDKIRHLVAYPLPDYAEEELQKAVSNWAADFNEFLRWYGDDEA
jgi:hypothetical protein